MTTTSVNEWEETAPVWSPKDIAARLGVHPRTAASYCLRGLIPHIRLGDGPRAQIRAAPADVRAFIEAQRRA